MPQRKAADQIRNNEPAPVIVGGATRPSLHVSLEPFVNIQRRQALNLTLMQASCAVGAPPPPVIRLEDQALLMQIARERGMGGNPLLRKQAVQALAQMKTLESVEFLWGLASSETEHESIRIQAIASLAQAAPSVASSLLETCLLHSAPGIRSAAVRALAGIGDTRSLERLKMLYPLEKDSGVQQRMAATASIIAGRLEIKLTGFRTPKRRTTPRKPRKDA